MKKRILTLAMALLLATGSMEVAGAQEVNKTVALTKDNKIEYADGDTKIDEAFENMAPGDSRTISIRVENQNEHKAGFFISQKTAEALEETNKSAGGAYSYELKVGKTKEEAVSLLDTIAGGYSSDLSASNTGLYDIDELNGYQFLAELGNGEYTNVYLTLTIDGEGFDSTSDVDYTNASGELEFNFRAYYDDKEPVVINKEVTVKKDDTVITEIIERIVPLASAVQTGDSASVIVLTGVLLAGILLIVFAMKNRKAENR